MGAYTAFLDLSLGLASPALGLVANRAGLGSVFLVSAVVVLCATGIAVRLLRAPSKRVRTARHDPVARTINT
jgi:predicted MFS family arabinose efflux permease